MKNTSITEYIEVQDPAHQKSLHQLRDILASCLENAEEKIAWGMPSYWKKKYIIHFQAFKNHMNIYIGPDAVDHFKTLYPDIDFTGRGFRLSYSDEIPEETIRTMALWCEKEIGE